MSKTLHSFANAFSTTHWKAALEQLEQAFQEPLSLADLKLSGKVLKNGSQDEHMCAKCKWQCVMKNDANFVHFFTRVAVAPMEICFSNEETLAVLSFKNQQWTLSSTRQRRNCTFETGLAFENEYHVVINDIGLTFPLSCSEKTLASYYLDNGKWKSRLCILQHVKQATVTVLSNVYAVQSISINADKMIIHHSHGSITSGKTETTTHSLYGVVPKHAWLDVVPQQYLCMGMHSISVTFTIQNQNETNMQQIHFVPDMACCIPEYQISIVNGKITYNIITLERYKSTKTFLLPLSSLELNYSYLDVFTCTHKVPVEAILENIVKRCTWMRIVYKDDDHWMWKQSIKTICRTDLHQSLELQYKLVTLDGEELFWFVHALNKTGTIAYQEQSLLRFQIIEKPFATRCTSFCDVVFI